MLLQHQSKSASKYDYILHVAGVVERKNRQYCRRCGERIDDRAVTWTEGAFVVSITSRNSGLRLGSYSLSEEELMSDDNMRFCYATKYEEKPCDDSGY